MHLLKLIVIPVQHLDHLKPLRLRFTVQSGENFEPKIKPREKVLS